MAPLQGADEDAMVFLGRCPKLFPRSLSGCQANHPVAAPGNDAKPLNAAGRQPVLVHRSNRYGQTDSPSYSPSYGANSYFSPMNCSRRREKADGKRSARLPPHHFAGYSVCEKCVVPLSGGEHQDQEHRLKLELRTQLCLLRRFSHIFQPKENSPATGAAKSPDRRRWQKIQ